jgi:hypothetical protein
MSKIQIDRIIISPLPTDLRGGLRFRIKCWLADRLGLPRPNNWDEIRHLHDSGARRMAVLGANWDDPMTILLSCGTDVVTIRDANNKPLVYISMYDETWGERQPGLAIRPATGNMNAEYGSVTLSNYFGTYLGEGQHDLRVSA